MSPMPSPKVRARVGLVVAPMLVIAAFAAAALWWRGTQAAEKEAAAHLDRARLRFAELESVADGATDLERPWGRLSAQAVDAGSPQDAAARVERGLRRVAERAGVRPVRVEVLEAVDPPANALGCVLKITLSVEGPSSAIVNWVHLLETVDNPGLWIDSATWSSAGDPRDMKADIAARAPCVLPTGGP